MTNIWLEQKTGTGPLNPGQSRRTQDFANGLNITKRSLEAFDHAPQATSCGGVLWEEFFKPDLFHGLLTVVLRVVVLTVIRDGGRCEPAGHGVHSSDDSPRNDLCNTLCLS